MYCCCCVVTLCALCCHVGGVSGVCWRGLQWSFTHRHNSLSSVVTEAPVNTALWRRTHRLSTDLNRRLQRRLSAVGVTCFMSTFYSWCYLHYVDFLLLVLLALCRLSTVGVTYIMSLLTLWPHAGSGVVRIDPLRFLAGCRTRRLNQA